METNNRRDTVLYINLDVVPPPDQRNITAEPGQNVTLPCRTPHSEPVGVEWSRTDLGSEYVLLYRNNQFDLENQHPSFKNRADLQEGQIKDGDVSLDLKNVSTDDRGTYECRVIQTETNSRRRETVLYINLDVVPPPGEPDDKNKDGLIVGLAVGLSVAVISVAIVIFFICKIFKKHKSNPNQPPAAASGPGQSLMPPDSSA